MERDFKGVWIPKEVWLDQRLNALDKIILVEIDSLDNGEKGCYASNQYLAEFCQCSERKIRDAIAKLKSYGYLYVASFDGRTRTLRTSMAEKARQSGKNCRADGQNVPLNNKENNIDNIIKERKKETPAKTTSYDEIINKMVDDPELKATVYEFIKMRKLIKKPLTDRALEMLINKLYKLEADNGKRIEVLNQSIINNWSGVYPLKQDRTQQKPTKQMSKQDQEYLDYLDSLG